MKNQSITEAMLQFIEESPTAFHAAANVEALLLENGFEKLENLAEVGGLIARAALERKESRGSHYRADYPDADPALAHPIILEKA